MVKSIVVNGVVSCVLHTKVAELSIANLIFCFYLVSALVGKLLLGMKSLLLGWFWVLSLVLYMLPKYDAKA